MGVDRERVAGAFYEHTPKAGLPRFPGSNFPPFLDAIPRMSISTPKRKSSIRQGRLGWIAAAIVVLAVVAECRTGHADNALSIADFVGHFRGTAQVQAGDRFFIQQMRDAEVDLRAEPDGFRLSWLTVIHLREGGQTKVRRRSAEMRFIAGPAPQQFHTREPLEPFAEKPTAWAYINGNKLVVHVLSILTDGNYELQTYERSVSGNVMTLHFSRLLPGHPELVVSGRLVRQPE